jgi:hypothetical protein
MFCIQVVTSGVLKRYVSGIDACIYRDMLKSNISSFLQKLVAA